MMDMEWEHDKEFEDFHRPHPMAKIHLLQNMPMPPPSSKKKYQWEWKSTATLKFLK